VSLLIRITFILNIPEKRWKQLEEKLQTMFAEEGIGAIVRGDNHEWTIEGAPSNQPGLRRVD